MTDFITLLGAEKVEHAGHNMQAAAQQMSSTYSFFQETLLQHQRFMDDWLARFESALKEHENGRQTSN